MADNDRLAELLAKPRTPKPGIYDKRHNCQHCEDKGKVTHYDDKGMPYAYRCGRFCPASSKMQHLAPEPGGTYAPPRQTTTPPPTPEPDRPGVSSYEPSEGCVVIDMTEI